MGGTDLAVGHDLPATERLVSQVAGATLGCPGVAALSPGPLATFLPYRTVPGVAVRGETVTVAIVARPDRPLHEVADEVRAAVRHTAPDARVDVVVEDIATEGT